MESVVGPPAEFWGPWEVTGGFSVPLSGLSSPPSVSFCLCFRLCLYVSVFASVSPVFQLLSEPRYLPSSPHSSAGKWAQPAPCSWSLISHPLSSKTPPRLVLEFKFLGLETARRPQARRVAVASRAFCVQGVQPGRQGPLGSGRPPLLGTAFSFPGIQFWGRPNSAPAHSAHPS